MTTVTPRPRRRFSRTFGRHGATVTLCERRIGGSLSLRWWDPSVDNWRWRSLRHKDRAIGEQQARLLAAELLSAEETLAQGRLTIATLFALYEREVSTHKKGAQPAEDRRRIDLWTRYLGATRDVVTIDPATVDRFIRDRRAGRVEVPDRRRGARLGTWRTLPAKPSDTTIGADIIFLTSALNWATRTRTPEGVRLLGENPLRGMAIPQSRNPLRPVATYDRYLAVRAHGDAADPQGLFGTFLELVEGLGWRVSAICALRGSDIDRVSAPAAPNGRILKRGEVDKEGVEMWIPMSESLRAAVDRLPAIGDVPLFPSPRTAGACWTRFHARDLLERAEKLAGLEPLAGSDFHAYRRAWATARKGLPAADVAHAGGWRDLRSLEKSYQHSDAETLLAVMTEPRKVRSVQER